MLGESAEIGPEPLGPFGPGKRLCQDQPSVFAAETHRLNPMAADQRRDLLVDSAAEHHFDNFHRGFVGHAHSLSKLRLDREPLEHLIDLRPAAVHHHRVQSHILQQDHVGGEPFFQRRIGHRFAAVLDHDRLAREGPDIGKGFHQHVRFLDQLVHRWALPIK